MVRLKEEWEFQVLHLSQRISIPYGAIKRCKNHYFYLTILISIPYGAIKELFGSSLIDLYLSFQFLMVRLKV